MEKLTDYLMIPVFLYIFPAIIAIGILTIAGFEIKPIRSTVDNTPNPNWNIPGLIAGIVFSTIVYLAIMGGGFLVDTL